MKISIYDRISGISFPVEVEGSTTIDVLKLKISAQKSLNYNLIKLFFNNVLIKEVTTTLNQLNIKEGDLLLMEAKKVVNNNTIQPNNNPNNIQQVAVSLMDRCLKNPIEMDRIVNMDEELGSAILEENLPRIIDVLKRRRMNQIISQQGMTNPYQ